MAKGVNAEYTKRVTEREEASVRHDQQRPVELGPPVFPDKPRKHHPRQTQPEPALCTSEGPGRGGRSRTS